MSCSWSQRESFQSFTIKYDVSCGFFAGALYQADEVFFYFLSVFIMKWYRLLSNVCVYPVIFVLYSINMVYHIDCTMLNLTFLGRIPFGHSLQYYLYTAGSGSPVFC